MKTQSRNSQCNCGSGNKYKMCCMPKTSTEIPTYWMNMELMAWFKDIQEKTAQMTDWKDYEVTEQGAALIRVWMKKQNITEPNSTNRIYKDLISYREWIEKGTCIKLQLNSDEIRYSTKSPNTIRFHFGVLDYVIAALAMEMGIIKVHNIDISDILRGVKK